LNFTTKGTESNLAFIQPGKSGQITISNHSSAALHVLIDAQGWFSIENHEDFAALPETTLFDSHASTPIGAGEIRRVKVDGVGGVPSESASSDTISAVAVKATAADSATTGGLVIYSTEFDGVPPIESLHYSGPDGTTQILNVEPGSDGFVNVKNTGSAPVHLKLASFGYFTIPDDNEEEDTGEMQALLTPGAETSDPVDPNDDARYYDWSDLPADATGGLYAEDPASATASSGTPNGQQGLAAAAPGGVPDCIGGQCIPYTTWAACGLFSSRNKRVTWPYFREYFSPLQAGNWVTLRCGTNSYGYKHLQFRNHDAQFEGIAARMGRNWRDIADWTIAWTLAEPTKVVRESDAKFCYSRRFAFRVGSNTIKKKYVQVVTGATSRRLISAYPSNSKCSTADPGDYLLWSEAEHV
jgi:hypothetical protein